MGERTDPVFDLAVWEPALKKYGAVVHLSVVLYGADAQIACDPMLATPIATLFRKHRYDPGLFGTCVRTCLAQPVADRAAVVVTDPSGLAVVGTSLLRDGHTVGAVVGGYALVGFCESVAMARLARQSGIPFQELWAVARQQPPISARALTLEGELLQVLGDTLLEENHLRRQSEEGARKLSHLASHDPLTDLPNRLLLTDRLIHALAMAHRHNRRLAVLFLDIDHFKSINDAIGHLLGDKLLRVVAQDVTRCVRSADTVSRHGGDEFVVVLAELKDAEDAARSANNILAALARPHALSGRAISITASIGISVFPEDGEDAATLMTSADLALYEAKGQERGGYRFFRPELNVRATERQSIETGLRQALEQKEFALFYQPKINLKTGAVTSAEALIRWHHPTRGLLEPGVFVPIAEHCGLIGPIGRWVVREACRQARTWQDAGLRPMPVAVNISAVEFRSKTFVSQIVEMLQDTGLDPCYLEIELTESVLMTDVTATNVALHALKDLGVQLAIDDFGTGWSSLSYLTQFPVDALKIDRSFVRAITVNSSTSPIVSAVINMARSLKQRVIAEGVETAVQLAFLQAEDCGEGQGYYFSRPVPATQFVAVL
jgi:diguanylate cyclase (GGDEF)-like protein